MEKELNKIKRMEQAITENLISKYNLRMLSLNETTLTPVNYLKLDAIELAFLIENNSELYQNQWFDYESALLTIGENENANQNDMAETTKNLSLILNNVIGNLKKYVKFISDGNKTLSTVEWKSLHEKNLGSFLFENDIDVNLPLEDFANVGSVIKLAVSRQASAYAMELISTLSLVSLAQREELTPQEIVEAMQIQEAQSAANQQEREQQTLELTKSMLNALLEKLQEHSQDCEKHKDVLDQLPTKDYISNIKTMEEVKQMLSKLADLASCEPENSEEENSEGENSEGDNSEGEDSGETSEATHSDQNEREDGGEIKSGTSNSGSFDGAI